MTLGSGHRSTATGRPRAGRLVLAIRLRPTSCQRTHVLLQDLWSPDRNLSSLRHARESSPPAALAAGIPGIGSDAAFSAGRRLSTRGGADPALRRPHVRTLLRKGCCNGSCVTRCSRSRLLASNCVVRLHSSSNTKVSGSRSGTCARKEDVCRKTHEHRHDIKVHCFNHTYAGRPACSRSNACKAQVAGMQVRTREWEAHAAHPSKHESCRQAHCMHARVQAPAACLPLRMKLSIWHAPERAHGSALGSPQHARAVSLSPKQATRVQLGFFHTGRPAQPAMHARL